MGTERRPLYRIALADLETWVASRKVRCAVGACVPVAGGPARRSMVEKFFGGRR
jgi:hypothetical protein